MTILLKWRAFCLVSLFVLLAACSTNSSTEIPSEGDLGQTCTREWPVVKASSSFSAKAKAVQYLLQARGYSLQPDGHFGPITVSKVKSFQRSRSLFPDGEVGRNTFEQLVISVSQNRGSKGPAVKAAQMLLGFTGSNVDGDFGQQTDAAVRRFQASKSLTQDGDVGANTWAALFGGRGCGGGIPSVDTASYDDVAQVACHNCYETKYADTFFSTLNGTKVVEIDFRDTRLGTVNTRFPGKWFVSHFPRGGSGNDNNCTGNGRGTNDLEACLKDILNWSNHNPNHDVITVYLDKKQDWSGFDEGRRPVDLDALLHRIFGNKIFKPNDLKRTHPSLREAAHRGWPSMSQLRGKVIFVLTGSNDVLHEYVNWRGVSARSFVAARANEANDVNGIPNDFNRNTAKWVVFFNIKSGDENNGGPWLNDIRRKNYVSRIWSGDSTSFCRRIALRITHAAYYEYRDQSCGGTTRVVLN